MRGEYGMVRRTEIHPEGCRLYRSVLFFTSYNDAVIIMRLSLPSELIPRGANSSSVSMPFISKPTNPKPQS